MANLIKSSVKINDMGKCFFKKEEERAYTNKKKELQTDPYKPAKEQIC